MSRGTREISIDAMVEEIGARLAALRGLEPGGTCALRTGRCRKLREDRTQIFEIRADTGERFFLKLADAPGSPALHREARGWAVVRVIFPASETPLAPRTVVLGRDGEFLLLSRIPGVRLNRYLYGMAILGAPARWRGVRATFESLGRTLASLHRSDAVPPDPTERSVAARVARRLREMGALGGPLPPDPVLASGEGLGDGRVFVHGNLGFDNILCRRGRVGLIDFEHAGRGEASDDLGRVLQHLFCLGLTTPLWNGAVRAAVSGLMAGYRAVRPIDLDEVAGALHLHLLDYYQTRFVLDRESRRVALLPVRRPRLERALVAGRSGCAAWIADRSSDPVDGRATPDGRRA